MSSSLTGFSGNARSQTFSGARKNRESLASAPSGSVVSTRFSSLSSAASAWAFKSSSESAVTSSRSLDKSA